MNPRAVAEAYGARARALQKLGRLRQAEAGYREALGTLAGDSDQYLVIEALIRLDFATMLTQDGREQPARLEADSARTILWRHRFVHGRELARADSIPSGLSR